MACSRGFATLLRGSSLEAAAPGLQTLISAPTAYFMEPGLREDSAGTWSSEYKLTAVNYTRLQQLQGAASDVDELYAWPRRSSLPPTLLAAAQSPEYHGHQRNDNVLPSQRHRRSLPSCSAVLPSMADVRLHTPQVLQKLAQSFQAQIQAFSLEQVAALCKIWRTHGYRGDREGSLASAVLERTRGQEESLTSTQAASILWLLAPPSPSHPSLVAEPLALFLQSPLCGSSTEQGWQNAGAGRVPAICLSPADKESWCHALVRLAPELLPEDLRDVHAAAERLGLFEESPLVRATLWRLRSVP